MSSLYKRASPSQARILRIVEGAVKNAADAHPELEIRPHHRRSIAKRAAGTLTAQWPDVLAARPSESDATAALECGRRRSSQFSKATGRGALRHAKRSPLRRLEGKIASQLRAIKLAGETERAAAFIEVLKMIARLRAEAD